MHRAALRATGKVLEMKKKSFHKNQTRRRDLRVSGDEAPPFPFRHLTCTVRVSRALRVKMSENVFYRRLAVISEPGSCFGGVCVWRVGVSRAPCVLMLVFVSRKEPHEAAVWARVFAC